MVASANRGVRGFSEASEDDESAVPVRAGVKFRAAGRFLSSRSGQFLYSHPGLMALMAWTTDLARALYKRVSKIKDEGEKTTRRCIGIRVVDV